MKKKQQGFTLIEIILSLSIGLVLFGGIMSVFVGMRTTTQETNSLGTLQENGRFALSIINEDLMRLNLWGDLATDLSGSNAPNIGFPALPVGGDCIGQGANNASFPVADTGHFRTVWGFTVTASTSNPLICITNARLNSDILQLKRVIADPLLPLADGTADNLSNDRYWFNTNNNGGFIFPGTIAVVPVVNNSRIWEYQHHVYYVRDEDQGDFDVPVLMQGTLSNGGTNLMGFQPLIEGIESIHFMYGVDTDDDRVVNAYVSATDMTAPFWDDFNILAVKVYVLARDILPDDDYSNTNTYILGDLEIVAADNFRRLLLVSTVTLHNDGIESWSQR